MTAIDEHRQLHRAWAAELEQGVECGPGGTTREQHVVDEHDHLLGHVGHLGRAEGRDRAQSDVVAVERHVERTQRRFDRLEGRDRGCEPPRQRDPAGVEADEDDVVGAVIAFDDLVRDARQRAAKVGGIEDVRSQDRGPDRIGPNLSGNNAVP
jgi:hypothetical protein